jgi:hypothetical protein
VTALSPQVARDEPGAVRRVPWRRLVSVTVRRQRGTLAGYVAFAVLIAVGMAVTGLVLHTSRRHVYSAGAGSLRPLYDGTWTWLQIVLLGMPLLAGLFLGAPLVAREIETGTARFAWSQGTGRARWLVATVMPVALIVVAIAAGLGVELRWWVIDPARHVWLREGSVFALNPLPLVGWMLLGFSVGVAMGAAIRRTVPAMAATLGCFLPLAYAVELSWQRSYLPPLHERALDGSIIAGGGFGYGVPFRSGGGPGQEILGAAPGWPDGRLLTAAQLHHSAEWFRAHHIHVWVTYQPGSRYVLFQVIEFGWLAVLSVVLIATTALLIRRSAT